MLDHTCIEIKADRYLPQMAETQISSVIKKNIHYLCCGFSCTTLKDIVIGSCHPNLISDSRKFSLGKRNLHYWQNYHVWDSVLLYPVLTRLTRQRGCYSELNTDKRCLTLQNTSLMENETATTTKPWKGKWGHYCLL